MFYVIAILAVLAFIVICFYRGKMQLIELKQNVDNSVVQVQLNRKMKSWVKYDQKYNHEDKMIKLSLVIYAQAARKFNNTLRNPFYRPLALLLGFKKVSENM